MEGGTTRGTTALVYLQLHSSLHTGTVHVLSCVVGVHPTGLTADQGCRQLFKLDMKQGHGHAAWIWTLQNGYGNSTWIWTHRMYWDMQNGHGHAAWI